MTGATKLRATVVPDSYEFVRAKAFYLYRDSIMAVVNQPSNDCDFLELYNLNQHNRIKSVIKKGNGPGEMLNVSPYYDGDTVMLYDFVKRNLSVVNLNSLLFDEGYEILSPIHCDCGVHSPFVTRYNRDSLIMLNPYCFCDESIDVDNEEPRFILSRIDRPVSVSGSFDGKYSAYNVTDGTIVVNRRKDRVLFASLEFDRFEIYDYRLNPLKCIEGPVKLIPRYKVVDGSISFNKVILYSYLAAYPTEDFVYLSYIGDYYKKRYQELKAYIFKFDWDGNLVESFDTGHYINKISIASDGTFYCNGYDDDGTAVLWKLERE